MHDGATSERDGDRLPADAREYFGEATVDESSILSPGVYGRAFNPIVAAEFRRWRARPLTYLGIVFATFLGICFVYFGSGRGGAPFGIDHPFLTAMAASAAQLREWMLSPLPATGSWRGWANQYFNLIARPSTILPLMMVWRALASFRDGGLYRPFRTTFLSPAEFLWGIIAVPFFAAAIFLVVYTGAVLGPGIVGAYQGLPPGYSSRSPHPLVHVMGILFEGGLNGAVICFVALYCGLLWNARPGALVPVVLCVLGIQAVQCWYQFAGDGLVDAVVRRINALAVPADPFGGPPPPPGFRVDPFAAPTPLQRLADLLYANKNMGFLFVSGVAKLLLCMVLWPACRLQLRRTEDELPLTPREIARAVAAAWRARRAARMAA